MQIPEYAIGQAIYVRTDVPDYEEVSIPFQTLGDLVRVCSEPRVGMLLDKVVIYAQPDGEPRAVSLSFLSASKGSRPTNLDHLLAED
ncbi:hypothetical protein GC207_07205 [bacterium]|nr:hypothetical protein [bacterium]